MANAMHWMERSPSFQLSWDGKYHVMSKSD